MSEMNEGQRQAQVVFLSHGGGPLPLLGDPGHQAMVNFMRKLPDLLKKPEAILMISAHWEEPTATLLGAKNPPMFYDYYGFPEQTYQVQYPAPGDPQLASRLTEILRQNNIPSRIDNGRGFDHGVFIPLMLMYPKADIPVTQLSLIRGLEPAAHLALGRALRALLSENILVIGSGFSFHNQSAFFGRSGSAPDFKNDAFQDWLIETCTGGLTQEERERRLLNWTQAPNARYCHPREEHLLPVMVCQSLADEPGKVVFDDQILGKRGVMFLWN